MIKKRLAKSMALMVACCSFLGASQSFANDTNVPAPRVTTSYNTTIVDGKTINTDWVRSGADIIGTNEVTSMQTGELKCWIVDSTTSDHKVVSNTRTYKSKGNYNMTYTYRPLNVRLKIQNPLGGSGGTITTLGKFHS